MSNPEGAQKPNFVLIFIDDRGYGDILLQQFGPAAFHLDARCRGAKSKPSSRPARRRGVRSFQNPSRGRRGTDGHARDVLWTTVAFDQIRLHCECIG